MITCTLNGKKYSVDFVSGRVLREIGPALDVYSKMIALGLKVESGSEITDEEANELSLSDALDVMVEWFCLLFGNQFTPDEFYDGYPSDKMMHDLSYAIQAVNNNATAALADFPTTAAPETKKVAKKTSRQS